MTPPKPPLPIDPLLPELVAALREGGQAVLCAPPGSGKTTRVPPAILASGLAGRGDVLVLEPRRLAARLSARRVAEEMGEEPGGTVGYQVRFDDVSGPRTRIRFVTEGILSRRLLHDPLLSGVSAVVLDEFHERHLHSDLALAWLRRLRATARPDLLLVVMSATLDARAVGSFLDAPVLEGGGRAFPVEVSYLPPGGGRGRPERLEESVRGAVRRLLAEGEGHVLVFLPGWAEIRRCAEALAGAVPVGVEVVALHGDLPPGEQDRAVRPGGGRRVILSTNVAETSVTIPGVTAVVDPGLARAASHSPWTGVSRLALSKVSRASAAQRAGRAGRTAPGRCLRLYTEGDHDGRPPFDPPEAVRADVSEALLLLSALAAPDLEWLDAPPPAALAAARELLLRLGAADGSGAVTPLGRAMLRFPLHPRLSRLLVEAAGRGVPALGAAAAAVLSEGDPRERLPGGAGEHAPTGPSDLHWLAHLLEEGAKGRFTPGACRPLGLAPGASSAAWRTRDRLLRLALPAGATVPPAGEEGAEAGEALLLAVLAAFPDRVGRRRAPGSADVVLCGGGSARLHPASAVREAPLLAAVEVEERREGAAPGGRGAGAPAAGGAVIRLASAVTADMLLSLFPETLRFDEELSWHREGERVESVERLLYGDFVLEEGRKGRPDPARAAGILFAEAVRAGGLAAFDREGEGARLLARMEILAAACPETGVAPPAPAEREALLRRLCEGRRSFAELREAPVAEGLLSLLPPGGRGALARLAPERVELPGGRGARVVYGEEGGPRVEARLADFFGAAAGPAIAGGRVPLVLHLLSPGMRPVQVTTDLAGFWTRHYPAVRKELMRRYPRHPWPEDPARPLPPRGARKA